MIIPPVHVIPIFENLTFLIIKSMLLLLVIIK